jgi:hypothetical protein
MRSSIADIQGRLVRRSEQGLSRGGRESVQKLMGLRRGLGLEIKAGCDSRPSLRVPYPEFAQRLTSNWVMSS